MYRVTREVELDGMTNQGDSPHAGSTSEMLKPREARMARGKKTSSLAMKAAGLRGVTLSGYVVPPKDGKQRAGAASQADQSKEKKA